MAIDDATQGLLQAMAAQGGPPLHEMEPAQARAMGAALAQMVGPGPELPQIRDIELRGVDGGAFIVRVLAPATPVGVIVYFHGGGWVTGHIDEFDTLGRKLAAQTDCAVVLVNYRKAPENPYPTAVDDAWTALTWVDDNLPDITGVRVPIVIAGDSAGGTLAAVLAVRARDYSGPMVALQVLIYPVTNADFTTASYSDPTNELLLTKQSMEWFWNHYCPPERRSEPEAAPLLAADLSNLPPAVVVLAEHDVLRSEGEDYAAAMESAGTSVQTRVFAGQTHAFFTMVNLLPGSAAGIDYISAAIRSAVSNTRQAVHSGGSR